ncbi:hypothetical protein FPZ43_04040 [Mucilaginibacter pallidiroseus]|uniref:Uncharacterized protein n=1 Tax=Mucilaginibacter pallidiroseus TaxID=2599295 RepID=A0A563UK50_9SPHI|nr:hypothetical protein [Mucilaginibacter pallidiroseus]TWR31649.1 hypothetical protein FPZ43_04040 [Mucilaginibacter pallidiroseus]
MKNAFKLAALSLVIAVSAAACGGDSKKDNGGDTTTVISDSVTTVKTVDSTKTKTDTLLLDSTKQDTSRLK